MHLDGFGSMLVLCQILWANNKKKIVDDYWPQYTKPLFDNNYAIIH